MPLPLRERCEWYVFGFYSFGLFGASLRVLGQIVSGLPEDGKQDVVSIFLKVNNVVMVIAKKYDTVIM